MRRVVMNLERRLELWARWIVSGCNERSGFASMLEMMMSTRCQFSGGGGPPSDELESSVEAAVISLAAEDGKAALILRVEYGAWALRSLSNASIQPKQMDKAHALGVSLRTYKRKLAKARKHVGDHLGLPS